MKNERSTKMLALYNSGKKLAEVGKVYGITRERVRQILAKEGYERHRIEKEIRACKVCNKIILVYPSSKREFCSHKCNGIGRRRRTDAKYSKMTTKSCAKCKKRKRISFFYPNYSNNRRTLNSWCKRCAKVLSYRWNKENPERFKIIQERCTARYWLKRVKANPKLLEYLRKK